MKAFGISALVFAIIGIFLPIIGYLLAGLSGVLAIFSAGKGTSLGLSAVIVNIINVLFLSPTLIMSAADKHGISTTHQAQSITIFVILLLIQFFAIVAFISIKVFFSNQAGETIR